MTSITPPPQDGATPLHEGSVGAAEATVLKPQKVKRPKKEKPAKRSLLVRLFGIGVWGGIKLLALCIFVGFFIMASNFDPTSPDVQVGAALAEAARQAASALKWGVVNFWKPALAGGVVVMPLWVLWRLICLPFRK